MTLYFENPVHFAENGTISTNGIWHPNAPLLAVASYSQEKGGFVTIFDELGEPIPDITFPSHPVSQVTALVWHPEKKLLVTGWENGELKTWNDNNIEFISISGPHKAPVTLLEFSEKGSRLVSCDSSGSLVGWKVENKDQIVTAFHHDLKECITHLLFRLTVKNLNFDIEGLAKAAVNGDEQALDIFSNWRPKTTARKFRVQEGNDNLCFYVGTQEGTVYYINQSGACTEVLNTEGMPLSYMLYHPTRDIVVVMMEGLTIGTFSVEPQGQLNELAKVKLSGRIQSMRGSNGQGLVWAGNNCLAILTGDLTVRIWDIETNDNYILPVTIKSYTIDKQDKSRQVNEMFTCLSFCRTSSTLCAGTNIGRLFFWLKKIHKSVYIENPEDAWELSNINIVSGTIKQLMWGSINLRLPLLEKIWATQRNANQVLLQAEDAEHLVNLDMQVSDMTINENYIVFTNGRSIAAYEIVWKLTSDNKFELNANLSQGTEKTSKINTNMVGTFSKDNDAIMLYERNILTLFPSGITMHSLNGALVTTIPVLQAEGEPIGMDLCGNYLTVFTIDGFLKLYDLSDRNPKLITNSYNLYDTCSDFGEIIQAKSNSNGTKVALTIAAANLIPDGKLYVWDIEKDNLLCYDFKKKRRSFDYEDDTLEMSDNNPDETKAIYDKVCTNRIPLSIHWDTYDCRLLVCSARKMKIASKSKSLVNLYGASSVDLENEDHVIVTLFISSECGIRIHDIKAIAPDAKLLALSTPYIVILKKLDIVREVMNDFIGLEHCNIATKEAVLEFSYNLSLGNMDTAFKAIKLVQSTGVWNSLARMCVKTKKLDVAGVCLGHMGNARAARALRQCMADPSLPQEAKLAVLAIQLNMLDDAEQLYIQCERYDLLNKLYQSRNKMDEALSIAETKDRIHLKNTEYHYAQQLEQDGCC
ncbi:putative intraflagellar transport protein 140 [Trypoxylus dichotomus]